MYGGQECTIKSADFLPGVLNETTKKLLAEGMVVATLNLPDRLKLTVYQGHMDILLYNEIHQSIHNFYNQITNSPLSLLPDNYDAIWHERLLLLKNLKKYLIGASFGGSVAVRHLQKYPQTFSGAISHDGALNSAKHKFSYLKPDNFIDYLQNDVLIQQNFDDTRVGANQALHLYSQLQDKENSFLHITPRGSGSIFCYLSSLDRLVDASTKGHFETSDQYYFDAYTRAIIAFMSDDKNVLYQLKEKSDVQFQFYNELYSQMIKNDFSPMELKYFRLFIMLIKLRDNEEQAREYFRLVKNIDDDQLFLFIKHFIGNIDVRKIVREALIEEKHRFEWRIINDFFFRDLPQEEKIHIKNGVLSWKIAKLNWNERIDFIENALQTTNSANEYAAHCAKNKRDKIELSNIAEKIYSKVRQLPPDSILELTDAQENEFGVLLRQIRNGLL